mmetsp:Transcript_885/g.2777  ORF Transcript_885/g.2777 Transcript_885/m.2777 type:complete len:279 (-) Transcript_885:94-930(-)
MSFKIVQPDRHDANGQAGEARARAERHERRAHLEGQQLRPIVRAALGEDADALGRAKPLEDRLIQDSGVDVRHNVKGARGRVGGRERVGGRRRLEPCLRVAQHLGHLQLMRAERNPIARVQLGDEARARAAHEVAVQLDGAGALAPEVLRALDRDRVERPRNVPDHLLAHRLGRAQEANLPRVCAHHDERVYELVAVRRAHEEDGRLGRHLEGVARRHVAEEEVDAQQHHVGHHDRRRDRDVHPQEVERQRDEHGVKGGHPVRLAGDRDAERHPQASD